jgi:hypothetical protein
LNLSAFAATRRHATGQPVLVATRTLAASVEASAALTKAGLHHRLLNAAQDHAEAEIISGAGEMGQITIASNMAGRGADIPLGPGVVELGGLIAEGDTATIEPEAPIGRSYKAKVVMVDHVFDAASGTFSAFACSYPTPIWGCDARSGLSFRFPEQHPRALRFTGDSSLGNSGSTGPKPFSLPTIRSCELVQASPKAH